MKRFIPWLGASIILVVIFGTIYGVSQQNLRSAANDPLYDLASNTADQLDKGVAPKDLVGEHLEVSKSLQPFVIIYDKSGKYVAGNVFVRGLQPVVPVGILKAADNETFHRVTWQPTSEVRIASVTTASQRYYILAGRSLNQIETDENHEFLLAFAGGIISLLVLLTTFGMSRFFQKTGSTPLQP